MTSSGMPSNKHFYCVNVLDFDKPVVLWETNTCTGKSCFIPNAGAFNTWTNTDQANCVEIDPVTPIITHPCIAAGQQGDTPFSGGIPSSVSLPVGGDYGLPVSFADTNTCNKLPDAPPDIANNDTNPPTGDFNTAYHSGLTDPDGVDDLDKRSVALLKRASPITDGIRKGQYARMSCPRWIPQRCGLYC